MALVIKFIIIRKSNVWSPFINKSSCFCRVISIFFSCAFVCSSSITSSLNNPKSSFSIRCCSSCSFLAIINISLVSFDIRFACLKMTAISSLSSADKFSFSNKYSHWEIITATGVRSSWDTSDVN